MLSHSQLYFSTCPSSPSLTSNQSIRNLPRTHKNYSSLLTCNGFNRSHKERIFEVSIFRAFKAHTVFQLQSMRKENWILMLLYSFSLNLESKIKSVSYLPKITIVVYQVSSVLYCEELWWRERSQLGERVQTDTLPP